MLGKRLFLFASLCAALFASLLFPENSRAQTTHRLEFAYAVNQNSNTLSAYQVGTNGVLTPLASSTFATGNAPNSVAVDRTGQFVYVANVLSNNVSGYRIGSDGKLTPVAGSPFAAGSGPGWVTVDPSGRFVYVANCAALCSGSGAGSVSAYSINSLTGSLVELSGSPFTAGKIPYAVAVDPRGRFAYVANFQDGTVSVFTIDHCSGVLVADGPAVPTGGGSPLSLQVEPHGRYLYVANTATSNVSAFSIGLDGKLTAVPGSPFASGQYTGGVTIDPLGEFVYVPAASEVVGFSIGKSGELVPVLGSPFSAPGFLNSITMDQTGQYVYAADVYSGVAAFDVESKTGKLTPVTGSPFPAGAYTVDVKTTVH